MRTDAEINLAIAKIEYQELVIGLVGDEVEILTDPNDEIKFVDYCNNWEDIGPIIEREEMRIDSLGKNLWEATLFEEDCIGHLEVKWYGHANTPTKAAALCFLKMRESE